MKYGWMLVIALGAAVASAQSLGFGLKAGVPMTALLVADSPGYEARTQRYTLGPTVELGLPYHLSFEVDLLYKRLEYGSSGPPSSASGTAKAGRWELPILVKYRFTRRRFRPFLGLGGSFNRVMAIGPAGSNSSTGDLSKYLAELRHRGTMGVAIGAGVERRFGLLRVAPEVRFTHWADRNFGVRDAPLRSNLNQTEFLIGLTF